MSTQVAAVSTQVEAVPPPAISTKPVKLAIGKAEKVAGQIKQIRDQFRAALKTNQTINGMTITPLLAEVMLEANTGNRGLNKARVAAFAADMKAGNWALTGESIIFSKEGILNDGQHRLAACILSGVSFKNDVRFGVTRESFTYVDRGQKRSVAQVLAINGEVDVNVLAAAINLLFAWQRKDYSFAQSKMPPNVFMDMLKKHPGMRDSIGATYVISSDFRFLPRTAVVFCHYLFAEIDRAAADKFVEDLAYGASMPKTDPVMLVRKIAQEMGTMKRAGSRFYIPLIIKAWNARRKHQQLKFLRRPTEEELSANYPQPE